MLSKRRSDLTEQVHDEAAPRRRIIRYSAAVMAAAAAVIYFMIGFNVVSVIETPSDQVFGIPAGVAYALGAVLLVVMNRRIVWILGALLQVFVISTYFQYASQRTPAYEIWGIVLRVVQALILIALAYLAIRQPAAQPAGTLQRESLKETSR